MEEKKFNIDKNKLWSYNEALYTEEFCKQLHKEQRKALQERLDKINKEKPQENPIIGSTLQKYDQTRDTGEVTNTFIKQHLEAKITAARWALALAMGMTLLFKGGWALWILFIILYNLEIKRFKKEALKAELKRRKKK